MVTSAPALLPLGPLVLCLWSGGTGLSLADGRCLPSPS